MLTFGQLFRSLFHSFYIFFMVRGFIAFTVLLGLVCSVEIGKMNPYPFYIETKARQTKLAIDGSSVRHNLKYHGSGITDGQEKLASQWIDQAEQVHGANLYDNALAVQQKAEDNWGGRWSVEYFGGDPSWGRATHVENEQWIIVFGYGSEGWDIIISKPQC